MAKKKKVNIKKSSRSGIPEENVLDLREKFAEDNKQEAVEFTKPDGVSFWSKIANDKDAKKKEKERVKQQKKQAVLERKQEKEKTKLEKKAPKQKSVKPKLQKEAKQPKVKKVASRRESVKVKPGMWWFKNALAFIVVCLILAMPIYVFGFYKDAAGIKDKILGIAQLAYQDLLLVEEEVKDFDVEGINQNLSNAVDNFTLAQNELDQVNTTLVTLAKVFPNTKKQLDSANGLLEAGKRISLAGQSITSATEALSSFDMDDPNTGFTTALFLSQVHLDSAIKDLQAAEEALNMVDASAVPTEYSQQITLLQQALPAINAGFEEFYGLSQGLLEILGHNQTMRYLVLFQNNHEIRPTGGFIGSLALMDISKGKVKNLEVPSGGPYDLAGQMREKITAPQPLHLVNPHWQIQDANWWVDFPTSAEKIVWFYEKSGGPTVDGVITFTPTVIENLLEATGPIDMTEDYGIVITEDNFVEFAQAEVERDHEDNPKQFIADLAPELLNRLIDNENNNWLSVLKVFAAGLSEKHILLYFDDMELEQMMYDLGWAGEIKNTSSDFLSVVNTNISGGKTDGVIDQVINHSAEIRSDGSIVDTVTVTRIHKGKSSEEFKGVKNINYVRFYVPEGSQLIEVGGFDQVWKNLFLDPDVDSKTDEDLIEMEKAMIINAQTGTRINTEFNKTMFGNWVTTEPGETSTVTVKYLLPYKIDLAGWNNNYDSYSLFVQKQPGALDSFFTTEITWPQEMIQSWYYPSDGVNLENNSIKYETVLDLDQQTAVVLQKNN